MDRLIVFYDAIKPVSHFGWGGALCGAEPVGDLLDTHGWDVTEIKPCPDCVAALPGGDRHIYRSADGIEAECGHLREDSPAVAGIDPYDPRLCERCWTGLSGAVRVPPATSVGVILPRVWP